MNNSSDKPFALRGPMRQLDAMFAIARKLKNSTGEVPEGMMEDVSATIKRVEKAFVLDYENLRPDIQKRIRKLIKNIKRLDNKQLGEHLADISRSIRNLLNHVLINSELDLTITDELGEASLLPTESFNKPVVVSTGHTVTDSKNKRSSPPRTTSPKLLYITIVVVLCFMGGAVAVFRPGMRPPPVTKANSTFTSTNQQVATVSVIDGAEAEAEAETDLTLLGYPEKLGPFVYSRLNPLEVVPNELSSNEILDMLMGVEYYISLAEPERLNLKYEDLESRLKGYSELAIAGQAGWKSKKPTEILPFFEQFIEFTKTEMQLKVYDNDTKKILLSDMLYAAGGSRYSLAILYRILAASVQAPISLLAPNGAAKPVVGQSLNGEVVTFNGEAFGLRESAPELTLSRLVKQTIVLLYPTMETAEGRLLILAWKVHFKLNVTIEDFRLALSSIQSEWLVDPNLSETPSTNQATERYRAASTVFPALCDKLLQADGSPEEAMQLFQFAKAIKDNVRTEAALLALGERAEPGAIFDGEPLAWHIAEKLFEQKLLSKAIIWWKRTLIEFPDDARPALRLSIHGTTDSRQNMLLETYRRGDHSPKVTQRLVAEHLTNNRPMAALALLDEALEDASDPVSLNKAVLLCMEMGKTGWALSRLQAHTEIVSTEPALQRLELVCELQTNGMSERAVELVSVWRTSNPTDPWLKGLIEKYGD